MGKFIRYSLLSLSGIALTWAALIAGRTHAETSAEQIQNWVNQAIQIHENASTLSDWNKNSNHPHMIFEALFSDSVNAETRKLRMEAFCKALNTVDSESLVTFDEILEEPSLTCAPELKQRLSVYWSNKSQDMEGFHKNKEAQTRLELQARCGHKLKTLNPTIERPVEVAKAPYFVAGNLPSKQIALTFDDGPHPTRSLRILKTLLARNQRANYFEVGQNAKTWPGISKDLADAKQVVGSHSMTHRNLSSLAAKDYTAAIEEIRSGKAAVEGATGLSVPFFRFPYGASSKDLKSYLKKSEITGFFWNIDSLDWKIKDPSLLFSRVVKLLKQEQRGIILFHDIHEQTAIALPHVLEELEAQGFQTVVFVPGSSGN